jgi:hypothetical protein
MQRFELIGKLEDSFEKPDRIVPTVLMRVAFLSTSGIIDAPSESAPCAV